MAMVAPHQLRNDLVRLAHRDLGVREFALAASRMIARAVPFDGVCLVTMDPASLLPTSEVVENGLPPAAVARMAEIEVDGRDVNSFAVLAGVRGHTAILSQATGGDLHRSQRHREARAPHGFGDELRAVLVDERTPWGALTLLRTADRRHFTPAETEVVASVTRHLGEGLRRAMLSGAVPHGSAADEDSVGLVVLAPDNTITLADPAGERWLAELGSPGVGCPLPSPLGAVARRARRAADERRATELAMARARVRGPSGQWLLVRGSRLGADPDAPTALIIGPAGPDELAALVASAHRLTRQERTITELIACGYGTDGIAARLHLSAWTVQDHLKSIFDKVGVRTRGELIARLFFDHRPPRLTDRAD